MPLLSDTVELDTFLTFYLMHPCFITDPVGFCGIFVLRIIHWGRGFRGVSHWVKKTSNSFPEGDLKDLNYLWAWVNWVHFCEKSLLGEFCLRFCQAWHFNCRGVKHSQISRKHFCYFLFIFFQRDFSSE